MLVTNICNSAVFGENPRYCYSLGVVVVVVVVQKLSHFVLSLLLKIFTYLLESRNMCSLSKEQSILSWETIQVHYFQNYATFSTDFLFSIKHPIAEHWHPHAVLLSPFQTLFSESLFLPGREKLRFLV